MDNVNSQTFLHVSLCVACMHACMSVCMRARVSAGLSALPTEAGLAVHRAPCAVSSQAAGSGILSPASARWSYMQATLPTQCLCEFQRSTLVLTRAQEVLYSPSCLPSSF